MTGTDADVQKFGDRERSSPLPPLDIAVIRHRMSNNAVDPAVQRIFDRLLMRHPDVDAIVLSTGDGVPLIRTVAGSGISLPVEAIETKMAAIFSIVAEQTRKLGQGPCRSVVAFYQGVAVVHLSLPPLVLTFIARDAANANIGMILDSYDVFEEALRPIRAAVEQHEREASSRLF